MLNTGIRKDAQRDPAVGRVARSKSRRPIWPSGRAIRWRTVDCVRFSLTAAPEKLPASAAETKLPRSVRFMSLTGLATQTPIKPRRGQWVKMYRYWIKQASGKFLAIMILSTYPNESL